MFKSFAISLVASVALLTPIAFADEPLPIDPRAEALLKMLPADEAVEDVMNKLPDLTALLVGLKDIAEDDATAARLDRIGERLESRLGAMEMTDDGVPDINGMLGEVLKLSTDKQLMGDVLTLAFQVKDLVDEVMPETAQ